MSPITRISRRMWSRSRATVSKRLIVSIADRATDGHLFAAPLILALAGRRSASAAARRACTLLRRLRIPVRQSDLRSLKIFRVQFLVARDLQMCYE